MKQVMCSCGSTNCSLIPWNGKKEGAKKGGLLGAVGGALIGLAGGPIGAIAGAAIGLAGGAVIGEKQPEDKSGRKIEKYKCNSCNKKFEVCPKCQKVLSYETRYLHGSNGTTIEKYCKNCNNFISSEFRQKQTQAQINATTNAAKGYVNLVKKNINSFDDYDD